MCSPCITLLSFRKRGDHVRQHNMIWYHLLYALRASNTSTATWQAITIFADSRPALMKRAGLAGSFNAEGCHAIHSTGNQRAATLKLHLRVRLTAWRGVELLLIVEILNAYEYRLYLLCNFFKLYYVNTQIDRYHISCTVHILYCRTIA